MALKSVYSGYNICIIYNRQRLAVLAVKLKAITSVFLMCVCVCMCMFRDRTLDEVCHKLCVCNAVRDALEGQVLSVSYQQLLLKPSKRTISFLLEVRHSSGSRFDIHTYTLFCAVETAFHFSKK